MESPLYTDLTPEDASEDLEIIETFGFSPSKGAVRFEAHLSRMQVTANALGFAFNAKGARELVAALAQDTSLRCRISLRQDGLTLTTTPVSLNLPTWKVAIAKQVVDETDPWRRVKTSNRAIYEKARANLPEGIDELIFLNSQGRIAEGTITNVFVCVSDGKLLTPPVSAGALPGILRAELLADGRAVEATLTPADLTGATVYCGNSLRGLIAAQLVTLPG